MYTSAARGGIFFEAEVPDADQTVGLLLFDGMAGEGLALGTCGCWRHAIEGLRGDDFSGSLGTELLLVDFFEHPELLLEFLTFGVWCETVARAISFSSYGLGSLFLCVLLVHLGIYCQAEGFEAVEIIFLTKTGQMFDGLYFSLIHKYNYPEQIYFIHAQLHQ
jgi:hypothetical protein